jgi:hypothetical protein
MADPLDGNGISDQSDGIRIPLTRDYLLRTMGGMNIMIFNGQSYAQS